MRHYASFPLSFCLPLALSLRGICFCHRHHDTNNDCKHAWDGDFTRGTPIRAISREVHTTAPMPACSWLRKSLQQSDKPSEPSNSRCTATIRETMDTADDVLVHGCATSYPTAIQVFHIIQSRVPCQSF